MKPREVLQEKLFFSMRVLITTTHFSTSIQKHKGRLYSVGLGSFDGTFENYQRLKAEIWYVNINNKFYFNFCSKIWHQPIAEIFINKQLESSIGIRGLLLGAKSYDFYSKEKILFLTIKLGYRSKDFTFKERLDTVLVNRSKELLY